MDNPNSPQNRSKTIVESYRSFFDSGNAQVYVTFEGFSSGFRAIPNSPVVGGYSFSEGLEKTTLGFPLLPYEEGEPIFRGRIDEEGEESNGLGVDCFSIHGSVKEVLNLEIYLLRKDCADDFAKESAPISGATSFGMAGTVRAEFVDPLVPSQSLLFLNQTFCSIGGVLFDPNRKFVLWSGKMDQRLTLNFSSDANGMSKV